MCSAKTWVNMKNSAPLIYKSSIWTPHVAYSSCFHQVRKNLNFFLETITLHAASKLKIYNPRIPNVVSHLKRGFRETHDSRFYLKDGETLLYSKLLSANSWEEDTP